MRREEMMNEVNTTLFIPLYGKAMVSRQGVILKDPDAERIWDAEGFPLRGRAKSKWLAYNMAMRARVFDDWTGEMLRENKEAAVIHLGCGLDSRCHRVNHGSHAWYDCDLPEVIEVRKRWYTETENDHMQSLDASDPKTIQALPDHSSAVVILEGLSMYLTNRQLHDLFLTLRQKYRKVHILMDYYTLFGARASKYKNPVNEVGVTQLYGIGNIDEVIRGTGIRFVKEHSFTPEHLVNQLKPAERFFFRLLFTGSVYGKIYRLAEFVSEESSL